MRSDVLYRITAPHFVAGLIVEACRVVPAAPILGWARGWDEARLLGYLRRKGWGVETVP